MYHIVICDDEPIFLTQISEMIIDILASMGESCEIRKYTSCRIKKYIAEYSQKL